MLLLPRKPTLDGDATAAKRSRFPYAGPPKLAVPSASPVGSSRSPVASLRSAVPRLGFPRPASARRSRDASPVSVSETARAAAALRAKPPRAFSESPPPPPREVRGVLKKTSRSSSCGNLQEVAAKRATSGKTSSFLRRGRSEPIKRVSFHSRVTLFTIDNEVTERRTELWWQSDDYGVFVRVELARRKNLGVTSTSLITDTSLAYTEIGEDETTSSSEDDEPPPPPPSSSEDDEPQAPPPPPPSGAPHRVMGRARYYGDDSDDDDEEEEDDDDDCVECVG